MSGENVVFVDLVGPRGQMADRLATRHGHYMPASLLDSQIATLEPPTPEENSITVDVGASPTEEAEKVVASLHLTISPASGRCAPTQS